MSLSESRSATVSAALTDEPTSTSDLYDRVGYGELVRVGLVPYEDFRRTLMRLVADGRAQMLEGRDGETLWQRPGPSADAPPGS